MDDQIKVRSRVEFPSDADVTRRIIRLVRADPLCRLGGGFVAADGSFSIHNGGAGPVSRTAA
jgi:hypothetical protein